MISVCIATYNGEKYIKEQLLSIIPQLSSSDEIIVSDDGSSDKTLDIIRSLNSPLIHIFENNTEHGYTPNFENALNKAKGDYIFLSDQDDVWMPQKVEVCLRVLKGYDFVISDAEITDSEGRKISDSFYHERKSKPGFIHNIIRFSYLGCCMAFRRIILQKAIPFPSNRKMCTHDNWLALTGMLFYKTTIIPEKLIRYRRHSSNASLGGFKNTTSIKFKIIYRLYLIKHLIIRYYNK